jgi:hypothetical protein
MKTITKNIATLGFVAILTACGGGGSSSGGDQVASVITYQGTYQTGINSGNITIVVRPDNTGSITIDNVIQFGVNCLPDTIQPLATTNDGVQVRIGAAPIPGVAATGANGAGTSIGITIPAGGGTGDFALSAPTPCVSSVGTVTVTRL